MNEQRGQFVRALAVAVIGLAGGAAMAAESAPDEVTQAPAGPTTRPVATTQPTTQPSNSPVGGGGGGGLGMIPTLGVYGGMIDGNSARPQYNYPLYSGNQSVARSSKSTGDSASSAQNTGTTASPTAALSTGSTGTSSTGSGPVAVPLVEVPVTSDPNVANSGGGTTTGTGPICGIGDPVGAAPLPAAVWMGAAAAAGVAAYARRRRGKQA